MRIQSRLIAGLGVLQGGGGDDFLFGDGHNDIIFGGDQHDFDQNQKLYFDPFRGRFEPIA